MLIQRFAVAMLAWVLWVDQSAYSVSSALGDGTPLQLQGASARWQPLTVESSGSDAIVASAQARSALSAFARQMLDGLDGRNGSSFGALAWNRAGLSFTVNVGEGANGLQGKIPATSPAGTLSAETRDGLPVGFQVQVIKRGAWATSSAAPGSNQATYATQ